MTQTFLPYDNFWEVGQVLDTKRLNSQQMEAVRALGVLLEGRKGWSRHPAVLMWKGYEGCLADYTYVIIKSYRSREGEDGYDWLSLLYKLLRENNDHPGLLTQYAPPWLGDPDFHRSHQSNLVRKNADYYRQHFPDVPDDLPYVWPVRSVRGVIYRIEYPRTEEA